VYPSVSVKRSKTLAPAFFGGACALSICSLEAVTMFPWLRLTCAVFGFKARFEFDLTATLDFARLVLDFETGLAAFGSGVLNETLTPRTY
jgi:hypothetical protein